MLILLPNQEKKVKLLFSEEKSHLTNLFDNKNSH